MDFFVYSLNNLTPQVHPTTSLHDRTTHDHAHSLPSEAIGACGCQQHRGGLERRSDKQNTLDDDGRDDFEDDECYVTEMFATITGREPVTGGQVVLGKMKADFLYVRKVMRSPMVSGK